MLENLLFPTLKYQSHYFVPYFDQLLHIFKTKSKSSTTILCHVFGRHRNMAPPGWDGITQQPPNIVTNIVLCLNLAAYCFQIGFKQPHLHFCIFPELKLIFSGPKKYFFCPKITSNLLFSRQVYFLLLIPPYKHCPCPHAYPMAPRSDHISCTVPKIKNYLNYLKIFCSTPTGIYPLDREQKFVK